MKKTLLVLAAFAMSIAAMSQFYVYKNGSIVYRIDTGVADSVSFTTPSVFTGSGMESGHEYVDLGLSDGTLWATCNVGASKPEEAGHFFAWGETSPKASFAWNNYKFGTENNMTKYATTCSYSSWSSIGEDLEDEDNAAITYWGGKWTMPADGQLEDLINQCYWVWTTDYNGSNKSGYIIYRAKNESDKGKMITSGGTSYTIADAHIFLPAAGIYVNEELLGVGEYGTIWSSDQYCGDTNKAMHLGCSTEYIYHDITERYRSSNVRPVINK